MLCGVVYDVLDCCCGLVESGSFSKVSCLSMYVTLVGILRGKMIHSFGFLFLLCCRGLLCFYDNMCLCLTASSNCKGLMMTPYGRNM
jgi:hypothetical protein